MKITKLLLVTAMSMSVVIAPATAQSPDGPEASACRSTGLVALQERSKDVTDLVLDADTLAISAADTKVGDVPVRTVILGDAYIARNGNTTTPDRFVCLLGEKGKVLLTFFTAK
ncbi:hypothetical protein [Rhizobium vignae]|jgi:hypothetical protein|uniref:hypothetical protein n=1 Tax=Neorhizobium vignae TaxID=690585 RepID=UPI00055BAD59